MRRLVRIGSLFAALALLGRPAGGAETVPVRARLEWARRPGAEGCIDGDSIRKEVDKRWGRTVFVDDPAAPIVVKGRAQRDIRGGWSVKLELSRADGTNLGSRRIVTRAPDCSSLDDALALALGLMLDLTEPVPTPETAPSVPVDVESRTPITIPRETVAARAPWHVETIVGAEGALGLLPGASIGGRFALAVEPPRAWRIEAGGTIWSEREALSGPSGARFSVWTLDLGICPFPYEGERFGAWVCVAQRTGKITATGEGFDSNAGPEETLLTGMARLSATWSFAPPFALHGALGLEVPFVRFRFVYRDSRGAVAAVYEMWPVAGSVGLGIGARF